MKIRGFVKTKVNVRKGQTYLDYSFSTADTLFIYSQMRHNRKKDMKKKIQQVVQQDKKVLTQDKLVLQFYRN